LLYIIGTRERNIEFCLKHGWPSPSPGPNCGTVRLDREPTAGFIELTYDALMSVHLPSGYRPMTRGRCLYTGHSNSAFAHVIFLRHRGTNIWLPHHGLASSVHYGIPGASVLIHLFSAEHAPHILQVLLLVTLQNIVCLICFKNLCWHPPVAPTKKQPPP
jgi:hypothetical protein